MNPFHLAIPVCELQETRKFYTEVLQCEEGRSDDQWVDLNFYGHQVVLHIDPTKKPLDAIHQNEVDGHGVPVPHFGVVLDWEDWNALAERLKNSPLDFVIEPGIRFKGQVGEQATMFFLDPSGNALEFKAFRNKSQLFAK